MFRLNTVLFRHLSLFQRGSILTNIGRYQSINHTCDVEDALDEEQKAIQQTAYQFGQTEMAPFMYEWDRTEYFPKDTLRKAAQLGLLQFIVKMNLVEQVEHDLMHRLFLKHYLKVVLVLPLISAFIICVLG